MSHTAHRRVVLDGEASTGVTLMLLDEGMDTGADHSAAGVRHSPGRQCRGPDGQNLPRGSRAPAGKPGPRSTATWRRRPRMIPGLPSRIWCREKTVSPAGRPPAKVLARRCGAYTPWPGLFTLWEGQVLKRLEVMALAPSRVGDHEEMGRVVARPEEGISVGCLHA